MHRPIRDDRTLWTRLSVPGPNHSLKPSVTARSRVVFLAVSVQLIYFRFHKFASRFLARSRPAAMARGPELKAHAAATAPAAGNLSAVRSCRHTFLRSIILLMLLNLPLLFSRRALLANQFAALILNDPPTFRKYSPETIAVKRLKNTVLHCERNVI